MQTKTETNQCAPEPGKQCKYNDGNCCIWGIGRTKFILDPKGKNKRDCNLIRKEILKSDKKDK